MVERQPDQRVRHGELGRLAFELSLGEAPGLARQAREVEARTRAGERVVRVAKAAGAEAAEVVRDVDENFGHDGIVQSTPCQYVGMTLATRIQLCGRLVAEIEGRRVEDALPGAQERVLFAYLVVNRRRSSGRSELVDVLWPDVVPANPETALSALLSKLRRALGPKALEGRSSVRLRLPAESWVDLEAAAEAIHRGESAIAQGDWTGAWGPGRVAQHIAGRGFLPGETAPWIDEVRARLEGIYVRALEVTAQAGLGIGSAELDTAERSARSLIACSPYRESGYRFLMEALDRRGNTAEALTVYEDLRSRLREELGASPGPVTQEVHRRLLGTD